MAPGENLMRNVQVSLVTVAYIFVGLSVVVTLLLSGWLFPKILVARVDKMFDQRTFTIELAIELADIDFNAGCRRIYQVKVGDRIFPETTPGKWPGTVVLLSNELLTTDAADTFRTEFLTTFVENYNDRMCRRSAQ